MPQHNFSPLSGELVSIRIDSPWLKGNLLGDPSDREVAVYLPPGYRDSKERYPLVVYLAAFTGSGLKKLGWRPFAETIPQKIERLVREGKMPPVIMAFPDGFTSLGGNQYVNSPVTGNWEDWVSDLPVRMEAEFRLLRSPRCNIIAGYSSGGYGALIQALRHGSRWDGVISHSGDIGFDWLFRGAWPRVLTRLADFGGDIQEFVDSFKTHRKIKNDDFVVLMMLAMAASYDPDPTRPYGIRLPVDPVTCTLDPAAWERWLSWDPLEIAKDRQALDCLRLLRGLFIDCGSADQYHLQYGTRSFVRILQHSGISFHHEEFKDDHNDLDYRLDTSLPWMLAQLLPRNCN